jgi:hypothetical protein
MLGQYQDDTINDNYSRKCGRSKRTQIAGIVPVSAKNVPAPFSKKEF